MEVHVANVKSTHSTFWASTMRFLLSHYLLKDNFPFSHEVYFVKVADLNLNANTSNEDMCMHLL